MFESLISLASAGAVGVSLGIIILFAYFLKLIFRFAGNHIKHLTDAIWKFIDVVEKLTNKVDNVIELWKNKNNNA